MTSASNLRSQKKEEKIKPKVSRRKEIIKVSAKINEIAHPLQKKKERNSMKPKGGALKRSVLLINFQIGTTSYVVVCQGFPGGTDREESTCNAGDSDSIPGLGRSPGEGNGYPLPYSCLENSMDRGAWWAAVYGIAKSWTSLSK